MVLLGGLKLNLAFNMEAVPPASNLPTTTPQHESGARATITTIIGISGPSSSGKTTLARLLRAIFTPVGGGGILTSSAAEPVRSFVIHEDDFYKPDDKYGMLFLEEPSSFSFCDFLFSY